MSKTIKHEKLTDTLALTERNDGFWLYDKTRGMNLSMSAKTEREAFIKALDYYQRRLISNELALDNLRSKVEGFVSLFVSEVEYGSSTDIPSTVLEVNI